jgi:hypothetical protein
MSAAESVLVEAVTHCGARHAHRVDAETANMSAAKAADTGASEAANVSTAEAANMSNAKGAAKPSDVTASALKRTAR